MKNYTEHPSNLDTLSDRLNYVLGILDTKKADLARTIDVKPQTIQYLCDGKTNSSKFTFEIATALGVNPGWLATGKGEIFFADDPKQKFVKDYKRIPILTNEQLINKANNIKIKDTDIKEWEAVKTNSSNIFCTIISDASMEPILRSYAKIFFREYQIDNQIKPINGDIVIVFSKRFNSIMIRTIVEKNNAIYLSPSNKELFKEIELNEDFIILGKAIECRFIIGKG